MSFDDSQLMQGFNCIWRIEGLEIIKGNRNLTLKSKTFKVNRLNNSKWHFELQPTDDNFFNIYLFQDDGLKIDNIKLSLFLLTQKGWIPLVLRKSHLIEVDHFHIQDVSINNDKYHWQTTGRITLNLMIIKRKVKVISSHCFLRSRLVNGKFMHSPIQEYRFLKQSDFINFSDPAKLLSEETKSTCSCQKTENLNDSDDLLNFFKEKGLAFVTLRTAEKEFSVLKAVLCAKSPVFNALFKKETRESKTNIVDIDDIDAITLSLMLQFLHLEPLKELKWDEAVKLYYAADKYQILQLRDISSLFIKNNMSNVNVCEAVVLADLYEDEELKKIVQKYFCANSKAILRSPEWKNLMMRKTELACEILKALADKL